MNTIKIFKDSFSELGKVKPMVLAGLLLAISIIIDRFSIPIPGVTILGFGFIVTSTASMLFGPVYGGIFGGVADVLKHFIAPKGEFFFGWTLNSILAGIIYGLFLYRKGYNMDSKKQLLLRLIICKIIISIFINLGLGTLWLSMTIGKSYLVLLIPRITKELILFPINTLILFYVLPIINKLRID